MTRKALLLFIAASVIWGSSFLFIRLAVEHMPPATVVFGRTLLGAAFLVPLAASRRAFRGLRPVIVPIIVVAVLDMAAPTFLTAWGEQHVSSSVAGILTATDPLFTAVLALWLIRSEAPDRRRTAGLIIGFVGVVALLGIDLRGSAIELLGAGAVILSALGYAGAALLYRRWLADQATDVYVEQEFEMTSQPMPPLLTGHVLEISFATFTPRITVQSERQLTVEIIAGDGIGFSDTVEYEAVAVRDDVVVLSWQEYIGSTVVHVLDLSSSRAYTAVTPAKGGLMRLTGRVEVKSET